MSDLRLPPLEAIIDLHAELIAEHGGLPGIRDRGLLEAALARPQHLAAYAPEDLTPVAAAVALCVGICRNHPFVDGNKRAGFVALGVTLALNGLYLDALESEATTMIEGTAGSRVSEDELKAWVEAHVTVEATP